MTLTQNFKQIKFRDLKNKGEEDLNGAVIPCFDIDWASDFVLEDTLSLAKDVGIDPTVFLTHNSPLQRNIFQKNEYEFGLHPNFEKLLSGDSSNGENSVNVLGRLTHLFPGLDIIRSHCLTTSSRLKSLFHQNNFLIESSLVTHGTNKQFPKLWQEWTGLVHVPITWEDDVWFSLNEGYTNPCTSKVLQLDTLNVLTFHPIHIYLNTTDALHYEQAKEFINDPDKLIKFRRTSKIGVRSIFKDIGARIND